MGGGDWLRGGGPLEALGVLGSWVFGPLAPALMGVMAGGVGGEGDRVWQAPHPRKDASRTLCLSLSQSLCLKNKLCTLYSTLKN